MIFTEAEVERLIENKPDRLLDELFELFRKQLFASDPEYAEKIGLGMLTVETIAEAYFAERDSYDPFTWAALNLGEARANKASKTTVAWRYAILRIHEVVLMAVPKFNNVDLERFHKYFKTLFVDDYATVPHQSIERLLALHRAGRLSVLKLGSDYTLDTEGVERGGAVDIKGQRHEFDAFVDATGQHAVTAWNIPFKSLIEQGLVREARTTKAFNMLATDDHTAAIGTGGIDLDDKFRPKFEQPLCRNLYCISIPFLLHKLPFVQGITSAEQLGTLVGSAIVDYISGSTLASSVEAITLPTRERGS